MNKLSCLSVILTALILFSCSDLDFDSNQQQITKENAEEIFGIIDPNQDWRTITSGSVTITADANLKSITKVLIFTESPFFNDQAQVLKEVKVTKGETVTLNFDAPRGLDRLIAACADDNGHFFIRGFNIGDAKVSFNSNSLGARTRGISKSLSAGDYPDLSNLTMSYGNSYPSYNAGRTLSAAENDGTVYDIWKNKKWDNDRLWEANGSVGGSWMIKNGTVYKNSAPISDEEKTELQDIFRSSLFRDVQNNKKRDNLQLIRNGNAVKFFDNHIVSDGSNPITIIPVQMASTEASKCNLFYYYYLPENVPSDMALTDYIKQLPKFKAVDFNEERGAFKAVTGIEKNQNDTTFLKIHEYILPFYGDPSLFKETKTLLTSKGYSTDGKFYRIKNAENGLFITYTTNASKNIMSGYADDADNLADQIWQIFTNGNGGVILYNVGSRNLLKFVEGSYPRFDLTDTNFNNFCFVTCDNKNNTTTSTEGIHLLTYDKIRCLKSDNSTRVASDTRKDDRVTIQWTFEEYSFDNVAPVSDVEVDIWPSSITNPSAIIGKGYRIGFMLRKGRDKTLDENKLVNKINGCMYSYGEMNTEINTFGDFNNAVTRYSMQLNDPRIAMFNANCKTYLAFEDGSDCNFSDIIIEIGGYCEKGLSFKSEDPTLILASEEDIILESSDTEGSGTYMFDEVKEDDYTNLPFTMCFEDRPNVADYDMNDVVLQCSRLTDTRLKLTLLATGAYDRIQICGIPGTPVDKNRDLNNREVHDLFGLADATGDDQFINTVVNGPRMPTVSCEYDIDESMTIPQFLKQIYIKNITQGGNEIRVPNRGEPPFALIIPGYYNYPRERVSITSAYTNFETWAKNANQYSEWLNWYQEDLVYPNVSDK